MEIKKKKYKQDDDNDDDDDEFLIYFPWRHYDAISIFLMTSLWRDSDMIFLIQLCHYDVTHDLSGNVMMT